MTYDNRITSTEIERLLQHADFFQNTDALSDDDPITNQKISELYDTLSETGFLLVFDWISWLQEPEHDVYRNSNQDIEGPVMDADLDMLRKLMTAYVRGDRFNEGLFISAVQSGKIGLILKRLKEINESMKSTGQ